MGGVISDNWIDPLIIAEVVCLLFILWSWGASILWDNYSQTDMLWSITPIVYAWIFTSEADFPGKGILLALLVTCWGLRLTFNFNRKGGYSGVEDYRWAVLRERMHPAAFQLFNLFFIAIFQHALLLFLVFPVYLAIRHQPAVTLVDGLLSVAFVALLVLETVADQQQWVFQQMKRGKTTPEEYLAKDIERGFLTSGLFSFCRHPNFAAEIMLWFTIYCFSIGAGAEALNWTLIGPVTLLLLFQGSSRFTEAISQRKYPHYDDYKRITPMLCPCILRRKAKTE